MPFRRHLSIRGMLSRMLGRLAVPGRQHRHCLWHQRRNLRSLHLGLHHLLGTGKQPVRRRLWGNVNCRVSADLRKQRLHPRIGVCDHVLRVRGDRNL
jgi:hypothetical protein